MPGPHASRSAGARASAEIASAGKTVDAQPEAQRTKKSHPVLCGRSKQASTDVDKSPSLRTKDRHHHLCRSGCSSRFPSMDDSRPAIASTHWNMNKPQGTGLSTKSGRSCGSIEWSLTAQVKHHRPDKTESRCSRHCTRAHARLATLLSLGSSGVHVVTVARGLREWVGRTRDWRVGWRQ
jgi:hypothetical protein